MADLDALVASPWWRWMPGMLTADGERIIRSNRNPNVFDTMSVDTDGKRGRLRSRWPDPTDPATVGCLLALMYEAEPQHVTPSPVSVCLSQFGPTDPRTVDAIIAAILAAPPPGVGHG